MHFSGPSHRSLHGRVILSTSNLCTWSSFWMPFPFLPGKFTWIFQNVSLMSLSPLLFGPTALWLYHNHCIYHPVLSSSKQFAETFFFLFFPFQSLPGIQSGPASWTCDLCSHTGPHTEKGSVLGLMLCSHFLEILNKLWTWAPPPHFHFAQGPTNYGPSAEFQ